MHRRGSYGGLVCFSHFPMGSHNLTAGSGGLSMEKVECMCGWVLLWGSTCQGLSCLWDIGCLYLEKHKGTETFALEEKEAFLVPNS